MPFVYDRTHSNAAEDRGDVEKDHSQGAKGVTFDAYTASKCREVDKWEKEAESFDDIACLMNSERRRAEKGEVDLASALLGPKWDTWSDEVE